MFESGHKLAYLAAVAVLLTLFLSQPQTNLEVQAPIQPLALLVAEMQSVEETYRGHNIEIEYIYAKPNQKISVKVDGLETIIQEELVECERKSCSYEWTHEDIHLVIKPVTYVKNTENKDVRSFHTWDTTLVLLQVTMR